MDRRRAMLAHLWLQLALGVAIAVVLNHAASAWFARLDLTDDSRFTLSPVGRQVMTRLEKPLVARVYFTGDLEAPYNNQEVAVQEKLEELRAYSRGLMEIHPVDPSGDKAAAEEAQRFGITPIPYRTQDWEGRELKNVFMGVSFVYGDRQSTADVLTNLDTIEYELLRAIMAVVSKPEERKTIGFLQGNGEPDLTAFPADNPLGMLRDRLAQTYDLANVALGGDEGVPEAVDALVVIGPQEPVSDRTQYQIDQFILRGGAVSFYLSSTRADFRSMRAQPVRHGLNGLLGHYGMRVDKNTIIDRKSNERMRLPVQIGNRRTLVTLNYPLVPVTTRINRESRVVRLLDRAVLPFSSSIHLAEPLPAGIEGQVWIESSPTSSAAANLVHISADAFQAPPFGEEPGPFPVAVAVTGRFTSFFADRPIPPPPGREQAPDDPLDKLVDGEPTRLVAVESADFVANNLPFVQNAIDWTVEDDALVDIRSRQAALDLLESPEPAAALRWKLAIALVPLSLLFVAGAITWASSRRKP